MVNIQVTQWRPDTCHCRLEFAWDAELPEDQRVHTFFGDLGPCAEHSALQGLAKYTAALDQNKRKNITLGEAMTRFSSQLTTTDATTGAIILKEGITFNWSFTGVNDTRVLTVSFSGVTLTTNQKNTLQGALNTLFGPGKVIVA